MGSKEQIVVAGWDRGGCWAGTEVVAGRSWLLADQWPRPRLRGGCLAGTEVVAGRSWLLADRGRDRGGRSKPRPSWARMEETETEVVTGGANRGHLEQIEP